MPNLFLFMFQKKVFVILVMAMIASLLSLYIFQVNSLTGLAYRIADYEKKLHEEQQEKFTVPIPTRHLPLSGLEDLAQQLHFQKIERVSYIKVLEGTVARNAPANLIR